MGVREATRAAVAVAGSTASHTQMRLLLVIPLGTAGVVIRAAMARDWAVLPSAWAVGAGCWGKDTV